MAYDISDLKVLIVDDSEKLLKNVEEILKSVGVKEIIKATSGEEAIQYMQEHGEDVSLIITDQVMDNMTGLDLVEKVRESHQKTDLPVIMLTSDGNRSNVLNFIRMGGNGYLVKPPTPEILHKKIHELLQSIQHDKIA
jgi:two-component system chemotaxis response regulator CheY